MTAKERNAMFYKRRKESGVCVRCGKPRSENSKSHCPECLKKIRLYENRTRQWYRDQGICPVCRKNALFGQEKNCPECRAKKKNSYTPTEEQKENHRRKIRAVYAERASLGICTRCGKRKAVWNRKKCEICLEEDRLRQFLKR